MKKLTYLLLGFIFLTFSNKTYASHILGGEVSFECVGSGNYVFTVIVYRDCSGISFPQTSVALNNDAGLGTITCNLISNIEITPICVPSFGQTQLNCASSNIGSVQKYTFRSQPISFTGIATPPAAGYTFHTTTSGVGSIACCRNALQNVGNCSNSVFRAKMYSYLGQTPAALCDASPAFAEPPTSLQINNASDTTSFNNNAIDPNLDSLVYGIAHPWNGVNQNCNYTGAYSLANPFAGIVTSTGNGGGGPINTITGVINFRPVQVGNWQACIVVKSYRCGILIAEVFRDFQLQVLQVPANYPIGIQQRPFLDKPFIDCVTGLPGYEATFYAGDNISFLIQAYDFNPAFPAQNLKIYLNGSQFGTNYTSTTTGCLFPPCATISGYPGSPQAGLPPDPIIVRSDTVGRGYNFTYQTGASFNWNTNCSNIPVNACGSAVTTYNFTVTAVDDQCPVNGKTIEAITIKLLPTPKIPSGSIKCTRVLPNGNVEIDFTDNINFTGADPVDLCNYPNATLAAQATRDRLLNSFDRHNIYRGPTVNGPWTLAGVVTTLAPAGDLNTFTDLAVNAQDSIYYYRIRTLSGCDGLLSDAGDTVATMKINASYVPNDIVLNWNPLSNPLPTGSDANYVLDSAYVRGGAFTFVNGFDSTSSTVPSYQSFLPLCDDTIYFRVNLANETLNGCISTSAIDSLIYKDVDPPGAQEITLVSVDTTTNPQEVFLIWNPNIDSSTVQYDVYEVQGANSIVLTTLTSRLDTTFVTNLSPADINFLRVAARDTCGNLGLMGDAQNSMVLEVDFDKCDGQIEIKWNRYYNMQGGLREYRLMRSDNGGPFLPIATFTPNGDTSFFDPNLVQDDYYCYAIWAINDTDTNLVANSNMECLFAEVVVEPEFHYLRYATVDEITQQVELRLETDTLADVERYEVLRSVDGTNYAPIGNILPLPGVNDYTYTDPTAETGSLSYYYKILTIDVCGVPNLETNFGRTILLKGKANFSFSNSLEWNLYEAFDGNVENYIIRRSIPSDPLNAPYADVSILANTITSNDDPVEGLIDNSGEYCYIVQAVEGDGNQYGFKEVSNSNEFCVTQSPRIFLPNAFVPEGLNREFKPKGIFINPTTGYEFRIFNRWGEEVFTSFDLNLGWNGTNNGQLAPMGVYMFTLSFLGTDGVLYTQKGSVTLVR